jgi:hypothetical protein
MMKVEDKDKDVANICFDAEALQLNALQNKMVLEFVKNNNK